MPRLPLTVEPVRVRVVKPGDPRQGQEGIIILPPVAVIGQLVDRFIVEFPDGGKRAYLQKELRWLP